MGDHFEARVYELLARLVHWKGRESLTAPEQ